MVEEQAKPTAQDKVDELKGRIEKKEKVDVESIIKQVTTRDKLERDYFEDLLEVAFNTAPGIKRMVKARRPTQKQMLMIMTLSLQASIYEKLSNEQAITKMTEIYGQLSNLAATLCEDKKLNEEFWSERVSFTTLQNFISELIRITQMGPVSDKELDNFRQ
jgi:methylphosphotriester-DNA--protein-cysteine methyltransferase